MHACFVCLLASMRICFCFFVYIYFCGCMCMFVCVYSFHCMCVCIVLRNKHTGRAYTHGGEGGRRLHDELSLGTPLSRPVRGQPSAGAAIVAVVIVGRIFIVVVLVVGVGASQAFSTKGSLQTRCRGRPLPHEPFHLLEGKKTKTLVKRIIPASRSDTRRNELIDLWVSLFDVDFYTRMIQKPANHCCLSQVYGS